MRLNKLNKISIRWLLFGLFCVVLRKEFQDNTFLIIVSGLCYLSIPIVLIINIADSLAKISPTKRGVSDEIK